MLEHAYFDNAATTWPKPESVYRFADSFFRSHGVNPGRSGSLLAAEAADMIQLTRRQLAACFNLPGDAERVVFTLNGTDSLNIAVGGLVTAGDHVIATRLEHNAVARLLNHFERDRDVAISLVPAGADGRVSAQDMEACFTERTRLLVVTHASNVTGVVQPLDDIAALAARRGVSLLVDAAQTAGVLPIDLAANPGIGALALPGHKGLFGPMGVGVLVVAPDCAIEPTRFGGTGVDSADPFQPGYYPHRLEAGTVPLPAIAGLHAAQAWFADLGRALHADGALAGKSVLADADIDALANLQPALPVAAASFDAGEHRQLLCEAMGFIHRIECRHLARIEERLDRSSAVRVLAGKVNQGQRVATLSFVVDGMPTGMIADLLDADHHIIARAGLHCAPMVHVDAGTAETDGAIRLSPGFFTSEAEMRQLLAALDDMLPD